MHTGVNGWIDIPVVDAIEYFSGVLASFFGWATHYAQFIGLVGLCWSAFKLANSRFTIRDFWWDTLYKWLVFLLLMNLYVPVTAGLSFMGNKIGITAGAGKQTVVTALTNMKQSIEKDLATEKQWKQELAVNLSSNFGMMDLPEIRDGTQQTYDDYINSVYERVGSSSFSSRKQKKEAKALVDEYRQRNSGASIFGARTLQAIKNVLVEKTVDGKDGETLTSSYVDLDIWLYDRKGNQSYYLSPAALLRVATLSAQVLWEKNQLILTEDLDELEEEDINFISKGFTKFTTIVAHVPSMIMTMLVCIALIFCVIFSDIQYVMTIIEYTIVVGIGAFFIPFILFDGTKELPKKLMPVFTAFLVKMIVINIIIFFIFNELIVNTIQSMSDVGSMNWVEFAGQMFFCFIAFILAANGPKIAQTIVTGQPQLSMGEFVQMAGSLAAGAMTGIKAAKFAGKTVQATGHAAKEGVRKTAQGYVNAKGNISKAASAGKAASSAVKEMGGTDAQARRAAVKGVFATASTDLKDKFRNAGNNFLHGGGKSAGSGSGGGANGAQAHQRSGQNTSRDLAEGESRTLNETSNPNFQNATRFDEATQSNVRMTRSEYYNEKSEQGKSVGNRVALDMMVAAEKKEQAKAAKQALPDNLTGGRRES